MQLPVLYPILDTGTLARLGCPVLTAAEALLEGGARILQFRHKEHFGREALEQAACVAAMCRAAGALFLVNDRADIARLLDAGLHVGQDDLPPAAARRLLGPGRILGFSTHNRAQFEQAATEPVDYFAFGPVFTTVTKRNPDPVVGTAALREIRNSWRGPLVAIGGITRDNVRDVLAAGADSVAVVRDILPQTCTFDSLRARMEEWRQLVK